MAETESTEDFDLFKVTEYGTILMQIDTFHQAEVGIRRISVERRRSSGQAFFYWRVEIRLTGHSENPIGEVSESLTVAWALARGAYEAWKYAHR